PSECPSEYRCFLVVAARTEFSRRVVVFNRAKFLHSRDDIRSSLSILLTWGAKGEFDAVLKFSGTVNRYVEYVHNFFHARNCWELSLIFLLHLARSVLLDEFQKAVTGMEGADVLSSVKMF
ncbi:hypothetical protein HID58_044528, partial [Brassica napus]